MGTRISKYQVELVRESSKVYEVNNVVSSDGACKAFNEIFHMDRQAEEVFALLVFDAKGKVLGAFEVSRGTLDSSLVSPRELFKRILLLNGHSYIIAHNHPSGSTVPSKEDIKTTKRLKECSELMGVALLDHLIISDEGYHSFSQYGEL